MHSLQNATIVTYRRPWELCAAEACFDALGNLIKKIAVQVPQWGTRRHATLQHQRENEKNTSVTFNRLTFEPNMLLLLHIIHKRAASAVPHTQTPSFWFAFFISLCLRNFGRVTDLVAQLAVACSAFAAIALGALGRLWATRSQCRRHGRRWWRRGRRSHRCSRSGRSFLDISSGCYERIEREVEKWKEQEKT